MEPETTDTLTRLAAAAEALERALSAIQSGHDALSAKIDRITAAVDEAAVTRSALEARVAELERENTELKAQRVQRKTLPPLVTAVLSKSGLDEHAPLDAAVLDKALATLSVDQRIAVKAEMARAGLID